MAEQCKDIDAALANLNNALNRINQRMGDLERKQRECCDGKNGGNQQKTKETDLTPIYERLSKIEGYINALDAEFKAISQIIKSINEHLEPLFKILDDLGSLIIGGVSSVIKIFTGG
jgi:archaellum component FlaC